MRPLLAPADYQPALAERHARVLARLQPLWLAARFEPIGASSIPGALSKGDLDVLMAVPAAELEATRERLLVLGYQEKTDTLRAPELCMVEHAEPEHALQLVAQGSPFEALFLHFRDRLRDSPTLVAAYNRVKQDSQGADDAAYRAAKSLFIAAVQAGQDTAEAQAFAEVLAHEQQVWAALQTGDAAADRALLSDDFLGVYPSGWSDRAGHAAQLDAGPSVQAWRLSEPHWLAVAAGLVLISYRADWQRPGRPTAAMRVSSLWQSVGPGVWCNRFSQDSPI